MPTTWAAANIVAGAASGLFFANWPASVVSSLTARDDVSGGLLIAFALFGPWAATGMAFGSAQWLVRHERVRLSRAWLPVAPLAGLGFMTTQFLVPLMTSWLLGSAAMLVAAVAAGWIIGALEWMLMEEPDLSANLWVATNIAGAVAAALVWYPGFPWALSHVNTVVAGAIAGCVYAVTSGLALTPRARWAVSRREPVGSAR